MKICCVVEEKQSKDKHSELPDSVNVRKPRKFLNIRYERKNGRGVEKERVNMSIYAVSTL